MSETVATKPSMADAAEMLWVVLANVSGGDWSKQSPEWQEAAARWRDYYFAAVADPPLPSPWQAIETAPKDGTPILVITADENAHGWSQIATWHDLPSFPANWYTDARPTKPRPTHWMPLPAPPSFPRLLTRSGAAPEGRFPCPICGVWLDRRPEDHVICSCCMTHFGYDDDTTGHVELRGRWLAEGEARSLARLKELSDAFTEIAALRAEVERLRTSGEPETR